MKKVSDGTPAPRWGAIQVPRKKGGEKMKKKLIVVLILATLMLTPTILAEPSQAKIKCTHEIWFNGVIWYGTVTFPNLDEYYLVWTIDPDPDFVGHKKSPIFTDGKVEKFYEYWALYLDEAAYLADPVANVLASGWDKGVFDADSWKYVMNGAVTYVDPIGDLVYLEGARVHVSGVATPLADGPPFFEGEGIFTFSGYAGN